jgi:uncharacterized protein (TIRG00374 family)
MAATGASPAEPLPDSFDTRHLRARLLELAVLLAAVVLLVVFGPGLGELRTQFSEASPWWLLAAAVFEVLSALSYVVIFRAVFCPKMTWRLSYQIGMSEQAANSLLPAGGAGGLALGAWALHRGGMSSEHIGRRTVAFFLLTSIANVWTLIAFAALFAVSAIHGDRSPALTYGFAAAGLLATAVTLALPVVVEPHGDAEKPGRIRSAIRRARAAVASGIRDSVVLLRRDSVPVLVGSFGYMGFDIAVLGAAFLAIGHGQPIGVLVIAYLIGQLGGLIPVPGGIGGTEGGLIGTFALYHTPLAAATAAVLIYRVFELWVPALLGTIAFVQLRRFLRRANPEVCVPLADPAQLVQYVESAG